MDVVHGQGYNFHYVALIADKVVKAYQRLDSDYNFAGYPSCFFDGGYQVIVGGYSGTTPYLSRINTSGSRAVPDAGLMVAVDYIGPDSIRYHVAIANGAPVNIGGPTTPGEPVGEIDLFLDSTYEFTAATADPDNDNVRYLWDMGDQTHTDWQGPFPSADPCIVSHVYSDTGTYDITVMARDPFYTESAVSLPLSVHVRCCIDRGNVDGLIGVGGPIDVEDLSYLVDHLFKGGPAPTCAETGNVDDILGPGGLYTDVMDLSFTVDYLFKGGPPPPACWP